MNIYLFDIEQSLAPIGSNIDTDFQAFFIDWMADKHVILVASSEKDETVSQIGEAIWTASRRVYQSNGNIQYRGSTGPDEKPLSIHTDRSKFEILDDFNFYRQNYWGTCHVVYFGTDDETIQKLMDEWRTPDKTHVSYQFTTYTDTWNVLKQ